jgi:hypothetical protein
MAQKTFTSTVLTAADVNLYLAGEGGSWTTFTPQIDQVTTNIAKTVTYSRYGRWGRMIVFNFRMALTAGGTAGTAIEVTLPVTAAIGEGASCGAGRVYDLSTTTSYGGAWRIVSTTRMWFSGDWSAGTGWGNAPNIALASGDILEGSITYEAAS